MHLQHAVDLLHRMTMRDPQSVKRLVETRVPVDALLTCEPALKLRYEGGEFRMGLLEVLNALFGGEPKGDGPIVPVYALTCIDCGAHSGANGRTPTRCPECGGTIVRDRIVTFAVKGRKLSDA